MAPNGYRSGGYGDDGVVDGKAGEPQYGSDEKLGEEIEKGPSLGAGSNRKLPFGDNDAMYATMMWWMAGMIMIAETISLGILSLPSTLARIGLVPGIILILGLGILATYTGFVIGQFKLAYPHVHNMADAGEILAGPMGREFLGGAQILFLIFVMGSHILTFSIMMNVLTTHGACTILFGFVGFIVCSICTLPRTLKNVSYMAIVSFISIVAAVVVTIAGVGVEKPGAGKIDVTRQSSLYEAFEAVTNIIFAYAGHVAFFSFISELKKPEEYPKALFLLQGVNISMYLLVAIVTYCYAGIGVSSPALGSTSPLLQKIAYGIAIPTIVIAGVINGHVAAKYIYVHIFRDYFKAPERMGQNNLTIIGIWVLVVTAVWFIAWIIAEAIPVFNDLLSLISALFASWFTYGLSGVFWLYLNYGRYRESKKKIFLTGLNATIFCIGAAICGLGLYASGTAIHSDASSSNGSFSCADNSKSSS